MFTLLEVITKEKLKENITQFFIRISVIVFTKYWFSDGLAYSFGVLLPPLVKDFDSNRGTVSWVGSLLCGVYLMSGPIVGGLVNKFGCRFVCILGSVVACIGKKSYSNFITHFLISPIVPGIGLSTLSPNVPVLMLTYGVIGGFGLGLIYLPAVVAVGYYFESKRALATGISVSKETIQSWTRVIYKFVSNSTNKLVKQLLSMTVATAQCGNFGIFLSLRFYMSSIFGGSGSAKTAIYAILRAMDFVDLVNISLQKV